MEENQTIEPSNAGLQVSQWVHGLDENQPSLPVKFRILSNHEDQPVMEAHWNYDEEEEETMSPTTNRKRRHKFLVSFSFLLYI